MSKIQLDLCKRMGKSEAQCFNEQVSIPPQKKEVSLIPKSESPVRKVENFIIPTEHSHVKLILDSMHLDEESLVDNPLTLAAVKKDLLLTIDHITSRRLSDGSTVGSVNSVVLGEKISKLKRSELAVALVSLADLAKITKQSDLASRYNTLLGAIYPQTASRLNEHFGVGLERYGEFNFARGLQIGQNFEIPRLGNGPLNERADQILRSSRTQMTSGSSGFDYSRPDISLESHISGFRMDQSATESEPKVGVAVKGSKFTDSDRFWSGMERGLLAAVGGATLGLGAGKVLPHKEGPLYAATIFGTVGAMTGFMFGHEFPGEDKARGRVEITTTSVAIDDVAGTYTTTITKKVEDHKTGEKSEVTTTNHTRKLPEVSKPQESKIIDTPIEDQSCANGDCGEEVVGCEIDPIFGDAYKKPIGDGELSPEDRIELRKKILDPLILTAGEEFFNPKSPSKSTIPMRLDDSWTNWGPDGMPADTASRGGIVSPVKTGEAWTNDGPLDLRSAKDRLKNLNQVKVPHR